MKICNRCVMDTTDSNISFNSDGVCDHCITFDNTISPYWDNSGRRENEFEKVAKNIRASGKGKDFDCIIGMSGGVDSSYLVYLAKEKLNLKPLVFHVDAGWNSQTAVNNIEQMVTKLNLDLYTEVINWEEIKDLQLSFFKSGVPHIDAPQDHAFFAVMYKFANKYNVKHILTGGNYSTECIRNPKEWMYYQSDHIQIKDIQKRFGNIQLKEFPLTNILWHKIYLPYFKGIKVYRPLDYFKYNKKEATEFLIKNFDYQPYSQKHFESRFTKFYESYWLYEKFGFDTRKVQYSSLILTNQMTRDEALKELKSPPYNREEIHEDIEFIANKLGITEDELMSYLTSENKTYKDYRNIDFIYDIGSRIMRFIGLEKGGKR